jgi:hypothetical protein
VISERAQRAEHGNDRERSQPPVALGTWPDPEELGGVTSTVPHQDDLVDRPITINV